jgi:hypothetical protein
MGVAAMLSCPALASPALGSQRKPAPAKLGVGLNTYSLRNIPHEGAIEFVIKAMQSIGIRQCELLSTLVQPASQGGGFGGAGRGPGGVRAPLTPEQQAAQKAAAEALTQWRLSVPISYFIGIRKQFNDAGLEIAFYSGALGESDAEIDRTFEFAKALGAGTITARIPLAATQRIASFAEKHKIMVGIQSTDADLLAQQVAMSPSLGIDLDIGDYTRAGHDALAFVQANYTRLTDIHLKDCKLNGPSVPFGTGDSHMAEILQFLQSKRSTARAFIDCDYPGTGASVEEVKKCYDYAEAALA